jgi:hypothetical protein
MKRTWPFREFLTREELVSLLLVLGIILTGIAVHIFRR